MIKYWLKNRSIFSLILAFVLSVISLFAFAKPNFTAHSENILLTSVYDKTDIDFDIPAPTKDQLIEIKNLDYVDDVFGYYFTDSSLKIGGKSKKTKVLFSDMLDSLKFTMYNDSRLISKLDGLSNPLYADYKFAKDNNVKLGDEIEFNGIKFQVGKIYETNTYYGSAVFVPLIGEQKVLIESVSKSYSGAYLKVNDISKSDAYLRNYKPMGRLKTRDDFNTDEEYQIHYNSWNNANYYNEITSFNTKRESVNLKTEVNFYIAVVISSLLMIGLYVSLSFRNCEKIYFSKKKDKEEVKSYYLVAAVADFLLIGVSMAVSVLIAKTLVVEYLPSNYLVPMLVSTIVGAVIVLLFDFIYGKLYFKKIVMSSKNTTTDNEEMIQK